VKVACQFLGDSNLFHLSLAVSFSQVFNDIVVDQHRHSFENIHSNLATKLYAGTISRKASKVYLTRSTTLPANQRIPPDPSRLATKSPQLLHIFTITDIQQIYLYSYISNSPN
jgi:hypothetical protein